MQYIIFVPHLYIEHRCCFSDDATSIGRNRSSEGHRVTFCDSLLESTVEGSDTCVITNDALTNHNNSGAVTTDRHSHGDPVSPPGDTTPKAPILRVHRTQRWELMCVRLRYLLLNICSSNFSHFKHVIPSLSTEPVYATDKMKCSKIATRHLQCTGPIAA